MSRDLEYPRSNHDGSPHDSAEVKNGIGKSQGLFLGVAALNFIPFLLLLLVANELDGGVKAILGELDLSHYIVFLQFPLICLAFVGMYFRNKYMYNLGRFLMVISIIRAGSGIANGIGFLAELIIPFGVVMILYSAFWMFLSFRWFKVSAREFSSIPGADSKQFQVGQIVPDAEAKLKRSQLALLGAAGAYLLSRLAVYFFYTLPSLEAAQREIRGYGETSTAGSVNHLAFVWTAVMLACFAVVYFLVQKRLKVGRAIGYVFVSVVSAGILEELYYYFQLFGRLDRSEILFSAELFWLTFLALWAFFVSHKSVTSILR